LATVAATPPTWSPRAVSLAERAVADTLAVGIAGLAAEQTAVAGAAITGSSPADLAFLGGVACHALDWDDYMHPMHGHCSAVLLPTAWALLAGRGSGADLLEVFLAGYQVDYLLALVTSHGHYHHGWHATSTLGAVGAAAAAARALRLPAEQAGHALGIAASSAAGLRINFGTTTKALHAGHAARAGVEAALFARAGARSAPDWLSGRFGFAAVLAAEVSLDDAPDVVREAVSTGRHGLETPWGLAQKPYACCGSCHAGIDAVISLVVEHNLRPGDIDRIELHVDPSVPQVMPQPAPADSETARYCIPWAVAAAAHDRALGPAQFSAEALGNPSIHALMSRVDVVPDLRTSDEDRYAGCAVLHHRGREVELTVRHAQGHPANPMTSTALRAKHEQAFRWAGHKDRVEELLAFVEAVPSLPTLPEHWTR
jgi:2-methylcitrate dehydratase PrpD